MTSNNYLKKIASGTGIGLGGAITGAVIQLLFGMIAVRLVSVSDYGLYTLGIVLVTTLSIISTLGFGNGAPQLISRYIANNKLDYALGVVRSSIFIVFIISCSFSILLFFLSDYISIFFGKAGLSNVLAPLSLLLVSNSLVLAFIGVFRGLSEAWPGVLFNEILNRLLRLSGLLFVYIYSLELMGLVWSTIMASLAACIVFGFYTKKVLAESFRGVKSIDRSRELVFFSLPIYGNSIIELFMVSASTLLLGYLSDQSQVGYYGVALILARMLPLTLTALAFIYLPIATKVNTNHGMEDVNRLYLSSTKWVMLITLPVFVLIQVDSELVITGLFGSDYLAASEILKILSLGYFLHVMFGPNSMTLLALGYRRVIFISSLIAAVANITIGLILIPGMGGVGAAISLALAFSLSNVFISYGLYRRAKINIFSKSYSKIIIFNVLLILLGMFMMRNHSYEIMIELSIVMFIVVMSILSPVLTRSLSKYDLEILSAIECKLYKKNYVSSYLLGIDFLSKK